MRNQRTERLCDGLAFRATPSQRRFIEELSEARCIPICEGIRQLIDDAMARADALEDNKEKKTVRPDMFAALQGARTTPHSNARGVH